MKLTFLAIVLLSAQAWPIDGLPGFVSKAYGLSPHLRSSLRTIGVRFEGDLVTPCPIVLASGAGPRVSLIRKSLLERLNWMAKVIGTDDLSPEKLRWIAQALLVVPGPAGKMPKVWEYLSEEQFEFASDIGPENRAPVNADSSPQVQSLIFEFRVSHNMASHATRDGTTFSSEAQSHILREHYVTFNKLVAVLYQSYLSATSDEELRNAIVLVEDVQRIDRALIPNLRPEDKRYLEQVLDRAQVAERILRSIVLSNSI